jgi:hypothetical protein
VTNIEKLYDYGFKEWLNNKNIIIESDQSIKNYIYYMIVLKWIEEKYNLQYNIYSHIVDKWSFNVKDTSKQSAFGILTGNEWISPQSYSTRHETLTNLVALLVNIIVNIEKNSNSCINIDTTNKYFEPSYDLYFNNSYVNKITNNTMLAIREQLSKNYVSGYSLKLPKNVHHLFEENMIDFVVNIAEGGKVDKWFPKYKLDDYYGYVDYGSEELAFTLKIRDNQLNIDTNK